ncbi:MAG TPA: PD-(D/E)XK nuclease family protein [Armatimonadota bacterium]|nr:PD-(D/E)XK nuclease family protein [Armatimonadota bacterium]
MGSEDFDGQVIEPLDLGGRPLTARAIVDWHECPMKFMLSQFVGHAESRRFIGGPAALHQAVRDALVECYRLGGPPRVPLSDLLAMFEQHWDGGLCADSLEEERLHALGVKMLSEYHAGHQQAGTEIVEVDERMEVELGGHRFVAVADVVLREQDGGVNALRWLTTRKPPSLNDMAESPSWGLLFVAARERYPDEDLSVTMYSLRRQAGHRVSYTDEQLAPLVRRLTAAADRITVATQFPTTTGTHCRWCRARGRCPALR